MDNLNSNLGLIGPVVWILDASVYLAVTISSTIFVQQPATTIIILQFFWLRTLLDYSCSSIILSWNYFKSSLSLVAPLIGIFECLIYAVVTL